MPDPAQAVALAVALWLATYLLHSSVALLLAEGAHRLGWLRRPERADLVWKLALLVGVVTSTGVMVRGQSPAADPVGPMPTVSEAMERAHFSIEGPLMEGRSMEGPLSDGSEFLRAALPLNEGTIRTVRARLVSPSPSCRAAVRSAPASGPGWVDRMEASCVATAGDPRVVGLLAVWLAGALFGLVLLGRGYRAIARLREGLEPAGPGTGGTLAAIVSGTDYSPVVMQSREIDAPCVVDRRTIVLPERCEYELKADELKAVLAHEFAHIVRNDTAWLSVARIVSALLWFQPLNRLARRRMVSAAELISDDWALARTGHRLGLARSISRVAEWTVASRTPHMAVAFASGDRGTLSDRVSRVLAGGETGRASSRLGRLLMGGLLVLPLLLLPDIPQPGTEMLAVFVEEEADLALIRGPGMGVESAAGHRAIRVTINARGVDP